MSGRKDKAEMIGRVESAIKAIPEAQRGSAAFAILASVIAADQERALADIMQYVAFVAHKAHESGQDVGMLLRSLVLAIAGGLAIAVPDELADRINAGTLLQEVADVSSTEEARAAIDECRAAFQDLLAHSDIQSDLDAVLRDDSAFDDLLPQ